MGAERCLNNTTLLDCLYRFHDLFPAIYSIRVTFYQFIDVFNIGDENSKNVPFEIIILFFFNHD